MQAPDSPDVLPENLADLCAVTYAALRRAKLPNHWDHDKPHALGRVAQANAHAATALFELVNAAKSYGDSPSAERALRVMLDESEQVSA